MSDFRFAVRQLLKSPGFTAVAVLTLALGIGANTAIFTVINSLLLRALPVKNPDELVQVVTVSESGRPEYAFSYPFYKQLSEATRTLAGLFAAGGVGRTDRLQVANDNEFVRGQSVSGNFFSVLGVPALLGRTMTPEDDAPGNAQAVIILSHNFWQRRFAGDPAVVGQVVTFSGLPFTIVGVTPPSFFGFQPGENPDLWWPLQMVPRVQRDAVWLTPGWSWLRLVGRLSPNAEREQAQAELAVVFKRYQEEFAAERAARWSDELRQRHFAQRFELWSARGGWTNLRDQMRQPLVILMAAAGLVLLIACANIASLLLARAVARQREFALRSALGAKRIRLVRQLFSEILLLAGCGAALGLVLAQAGTRLLQTLFGLPGDAATLSLSPDARVLVFTTSAALIVSVLLALVPAWRVRRQNLAAVLKAGTSSLSGGAERQRALKALVVAQVALSLILLAGAGLFVRTLQNLKGLTAGFERQNLVLFNVDFAEVPDAARLNQFHTEMIARLESLSDVRAATLFDFGFLSGNYWTDRLLPEHYDAQPGEDLDCSGTRVGPRFFETFGTPVLFGRAFSAAEARTSATPNVAVINQALARRYFGDANPLGRRLYFDHRPEVKMEVIGVVADAKYRSLRLSAPPTIYLPFSRPEPGATFALRTAGETQFTIESLATVAREFNRSVRVRDLRTMTDVVNDSIGQERMIAHLGGTFSVFAVALACLGLYGVLSFAVVQRAREIGVRVALGAMRRDVAWLVIGRGLWLTVVGVMFGFVGAVFATRSLSSLLFGVTPIDPLTFGGVIVLLLALAIFASWLPARRAMNVDPLEALRHE